MSEFSKIKEKAEALQTAIGRCYQPVEDNFASPHFQSEELKKRFRGQVERLRTIDTEMRAVVLAADSLRNKNPKQHKGSKFAELVNEKLSDDAVYGPSENNAVRLLEAMDKDLRRDDDIEVECDDGSGMIVGLMTYSKKDPISKSDIVNPVQNKFCKHVYDRATVDAFIKQQVRIRQLRQCPVASCPNKRNMDMKDLIDFPDFFKFVRDED